MQLQNTVKQLIQRNWHWLTVLSAFTAVRAVLKWRKRIHLQDRVVFITGGGRGLGLAMAEEFAKEGAKLVLCARNAEELERARLKLSVLEADILTLTCDVANTEQVQQAITQTLQRFGRIDILVNNAGIINVGPWQTQTRQDFEEAMHIMFWGIYNTTMAVLPHMLAHRNGRMVNITSVGGKVSVPHLLPYSSAKFAAVGFSEGLHAEVAKDGITVLTVVPGLMRTGSPINTVIKGEQHRTEYTLFSLLDVLPVSSISARRAAHQIVKATKRGDTELIISVQAQFLSRIHGAFPALVTNFLALTNRLLPTSKSKGTQRHSGRESETAITRSALTILGQRAARKYNE